MLQKKVGAAPSEPSAEAKASVQPGRACGMARFRSAQAGARVATTQSLKGLQAASLYSMISHPGSYYDSHGGAARPPMSGGSHFVILLRSKAM